MIQTDMFTAPQLRDAGMRLALESAEQKEPNWGDECFELLKKYLSENGEPFQVEDFRAWCEIKIADPPSLRAYGGVIVRAAKRGLVRSIGYEKTNNPVAHCARANVWIRKELTAGFMKLMDENL